MPSFFLYLLFKNKKILFNKKYLKEAIKIIKKKDERKRRLLREIEKDSKKKFKEGSVETKKRKRDKREIGGRRCARERQDEEDERSATRIG